MSSLSNILLDKEILLESGTNELELLVFEVADYTFGINVAKVREVLPTTEITALPKAHPAIRGVFKLRNQVIPCVSLLTHLGIAPTSDNPESTMILTDFNQQQTAFMVDAVDRIYRLSWENILSVPGLEALSHTPVTALARCDDRLIVMLDFEMVLDDVTSQFFRTDSVDNPMGLPRETLRIILAEDSPTVRDAIGTTLRASGYTQLLFYENGLEAWKSMEERLIETGSAEKVADLVISDVEMPQVDGFHLTKRIKQHPQLKNTPVLLYSSIVTPDNHKKGVAVGADAQVSKPELSEVVRLADELISSAQQENRASGLRAIAEAAEMPPVKTEAAASVPAVEQPAVKPPATQEPALPASTASELPSSQTSPPPAPNSIPSTVPSPGNVRPQLWLTFHRELTTHAAHLRALFLRSESGDHGDVLFNEIQRTLHTIKSAAMVVPLEPVSRCTHLAESLMEAARADRSRWPQAQLWRYQVWIESLVAPPLDIAHSLEAGAQLEAELAVEPASVG